MHGEKNEMMLRTRSYESEVSICFCHPLLALLTNPDGQVEARLACNRDHYLLHDLDLQAIAEVRNKEHTHLRDRVSEIYL